MGYNLLTKMGCIRVITTTNPLSLKFVWQGHIKPLKGEHLGLKGTQPDPVGGGSVVGFWCLEKSCRNRGGWRPGEGSWFLMPVSFVFQGNVVFTCYMCIVPIFVGCLPYMFKWFLSKCIPGISGGPILVLVCCLRMFNGGPASCVY